MRVLIAASILAALAACTPPLSAQLDRGGVDSQTFERDSSACQMAAASSPLASFYESNYFECMRAKGYQRRP